MSDLTELYQELILDHNRRPRNRGALDQPDHAADGYNPLCGDRVHLELMVRDGVIDDVRFDGDGCAISTASASLMSEAVKGKTVEEARALFVRFHALVTDGGTDAHTDADAHTDTHTHTGTGAGTGAGAGAPSLGKLEAFAGVRQYPARVKCATLAWHTLTSALDDGDQVVTTE